MVSVEPVRLATRAPTCLRKEIRRQAGEDPSDVEGGIGIKAVREAMKLRRVPGEDRGGRKAGCSEEVEARNTGLDARLSDLSLIHIFDMKHARDVLREADRAIAAGLIQYTVLVAERSCD